MTFCKKMLHVVLGLWPFINKLFVFYCIVLMGRRPGMTFEQRERAISMPTAGMSARDVARHFQLHESTISDY